MPDQVRLPSHSNALDLPPALRIEQAEFNPVGMFREKRKIDAFAIPGGPERIGFARPYGNF